MVKSISILCIVLAVSFVSCTTKKPAQPDQTKLAQAKHLVDQMVGVVQKHSVDDWDSTNNELTTLGGDDLIKELSETERQELNAYAKQAAAKIQDRIDAVNKKVEERFAGDASIRSAANCPDANKCTQCVGIHRRCCYKNVGNGLCAGAWSCPAKVGDACNASSGCYCP